MRLLQEEREAATSPENLLDEKSRCWSEEQLVNNGNSVVKLLAERSKYSKLLQFVTGSSPETLFPFKEKFWRFPQPSESSQATAFWPEILL